MLIRTRFAETNQLHLVRMPGGARRQITFFDDAVGNAGFRPSDGNTIVFSKDAGGNEFHQLYRLDLATGERTLLTDGKSRNTGGAWSRDGKWLVFSSTRRTGNDTDLWIVDPSSPEGARMVQQVEGGGWFGSDLSRDGKKLLVTSVTSANESDLYLVDVEKGTRTQITPEQGAVKIARSAPYFSADDTEIFFTTDEGSEFQTLVRMTLADGRTETVAKKKWDVDAFALSDDRTRLAYITNENGVDVC